MSNEKIAKVIQFDEKKRDQRSRIVLALLTLLVLGVFVWTKRDKTTEVQYQTVQAEKGTIVSTISASGTVVSANTFTIKTSASGVVTKVYVRDGDEVKKGQKIADIELDLDGEQQYAQAYSSYISAVNQLNIAKNSLRSAEASLNNVYDQIKGHEDDESFAMIETRTKAEVAKDNAYNSLINAQAGLTNADFNLKANSPTVLAPNSGIVQGLTIVEGLPLSAQTTTTGTRTGQRIASIIKSGNPLISVNLSEIDVPKVKVGQKATVTFDSISDEASDIQKTFTGVVTTIDRTGATSSNVTSYPAIIKLDTNSEQILPNMATTANIIINVKSDVLVTPLSAVQTSNDASIVRVMREDQIISVQVEVGESNDTQIEILSGVYEGDTVVTGQTGATTPGSSEVTSPFGNTRGGFGGTGGFGGGRPN